MICPSCDGWGTRPTLGLDRKQCRTCKGSGLVRIVANGPRVVTEPHRALPGQTEMEFERSSDDGDE